MESQGSSESTTDTLAVFTNHPENPDNTIDHGKLSGIGYWGAVAHLIRATIVTGVLLLPFVMKILGYITGTVVLITVIILYYHIIHILLYLDSGLRKRLKVPRLTYAIIADEIFATAPYPLNKFRGFLLFLIYIYYLVPTSKSISLVVISNNIQQIAKFYNIDLNQTVIITILVLALTIFCLFRSLLKMLVPFSSITDVFTFIILFVIVIYSIRNRDINATVKPVEDVNIMVVMRGMAIYLNSLLSAYILVPLRNDMKDAEDLAGVFGGLNVTAVIIVIFYYIFALIPYLCFGSAIHANVLANVSVDDALILSINVGYSLALFVAYILSFYACFDVLWSTKLQSKMAGSKYSSWVEYAIRIGLNAVTWLTAVGIADMALITSMGGIIGILLELACIPLLQILFMISQGEKNNWIVLKNGLLIAVSSVFFFVSIVDLVNEVIKLYGT